MASIETSQLDDLAPTADRLRPVRIWLYCIAVLVIVMVAVGGITRLTGSGLSIVEWKPISGTLPPLSEAEWVADFEAYKQIPQYQFVNKGMSLDEFKFIFFWEWAHRFLGRVIGVAFAIPFLVFFAQRRFSWNLAAPSPGSLFSAASRALWAGGWSRLACPSASMSRSTAWQPTWVPLPSSSWP